MNPINPDDVLQLLQSWDVTIIHSRHQVTIIESRPDPSADTLLQTSGHCMIVKWEAFINCTPLMRSKCNCSSHDTLTHSSTETADQSTEASWKVLIKCFLMKRSGYHHSPHGTLTHTFLQTLGQSKVAPEKAAIIYATDPVWGAAFAYAILGERLGLQGLAGCGLLFLATIFSSTQAKKAEWWSGFKKRYIRRSLQRVASNKERFVGKANQHGHLGLQDGHTGWMPWEVLSIVQSSWPLARLTTF